MNRGTEICRVEGLKKQFLVEKGFLKRVTGLINAVDNVSLSVFEGETLGVVGESGCGKSTLARTMVRLHAPSAGTVRYHLDGHLVDITNLGQRQLRANGFRRNVQMIFQDPNSSLDPRKNAMDIISEPVRINRTLPRGEMADWVKHLMEIVGLSATHLRRYPHAFSGGQRQRISIARALSTNPRFIIADEPTSALDVSVQAHILNLLVRLQRELGLSYLFISHNLGVIRYICDRVLVMYLGRVAEHASAQGLFDHPLHPYTETLLRAVPLANPRIESGLESAPGDIGNPLNPPSGCYFHPRCRYADQVCRESVPELREQGSGHWVACHHAERLSLAGVRSAFRQRC